MYLLTPGGIESKGEQLFHASSYHDRTNRKEVLRSGMKEGVRTTLD